MSKKQKHKKKHSKSAFVHTPEQIDETHTPQTAPLEKVVTQTVSSSETHSSMQELRTIGLILALLLIIVVAIVVTSQKSDYLTRLSTYIAHLVNIE